jgi:hypothetical protein
MKTLFLAMFAIFTLSVSAQEFRGTFTGLVTDPTGAPLGGAKVTITEIHTGTKNQTTADSAGQYTAPFLLPGDYNIVAEAPGFKQYIRQNIHLGAADKIAIDIALEVGDSSQSVSVSADAPLLTSENASVGQSITTKEVEELPLNGRTPMVLASLSVGVIATGQPGLIHPFDAGGAAGWSIGGGYAQTSEILVDGSPNATWDGRLAYSVPQDAVQEVRIKAFDTDAAYGHTGGGTINQVMKGGTNTLHGSVYEFTQPNTLIANNFFNNAKGVARPVTHYNQYGATVGGPILIPKLYDGRNKLFWFFAYERLKDSQPNASFLTVPTAAEKAGDLSLFLTADKTVVYNPNTGVQSGTTITRSPFPNNVIPTSLLSPIALAYLKFYPDPNVSPTRGDGFQNFANNATTNDDYNNQLGRLDYNMSERNRMFFDVRRTGYSQEKNNYFNNAAEGSILFRSNWGASFDDVFIFNSSNVVNVRLNFTRLAEVHALPGSGFNPSTLGFPANVGSSSDYLQLPIVTFSSNSGFQNLGATGANKIPSQSFQLFGDWVHIKGNHTFKFGGDARQYRLNTFTAGNATGSYSFSGNSYVRASSSASSTVAAGQDFATFLLGLPYSATYDLNTFGSWYSYYGGIFAQDDWRVSHTLTVNLGVRFDHDAPYHEKYGRTVNGFNNTTPNPLAAAAIAAYAKNPIAQLPVNQFNPVGGLNYPSMSNTVAYNNTSHLVSPRIGFAWSPERLHAKTVIRGGFGMFVSPVTISTLAINGAYSTNPITNQQGFSQTTSPSVTSNNYLTPGLTLANAFAGGFSQPGGSSAGLGTFVGQTISFLAPNIGNPYSVRWNFGVQQQLTKNLLLEVVYVGNHSVHLPVAITQINGLPRSLLSTLNVRDPNQTYLSNSAPNPFAGLQTSQNSATTTVAQLLAKYPQFPLGYGSGSFSGSTGVLENNLAVGSSYFQSLNVHAQQRFSGNLYFTFNYIWSKLIEKDSWLNDTDAQPEKRISPSDHPQRFIIAASYRLPVGKGQKFDTHSKWENNVVGGWRINTIYTFQVGGPLTWVNGSTASPGDYVYLGGPLNVDPRNVNGLAFNTAAFDTKTADAFNYHIRNFSTTFPNVRGDGINQLDASVLKRFSLPKADERKYFELRFEGFNIVNHPVFATPNTTATNAAFGTITATANLVRTIQVAAKIVF